ncbi:hypothetical protein ACQEU8_35885 [Streptomyces sp. CA-250714]|uniref:hypothetical protein n=1 Tax=Streptomyces sp. CA-250714 TaxID=3240060 RepID=UPI003D8D3D1B
MKATRKNFLQALQAMATLNNACPQGENGESCVWVQFEGFKQCGRCYATEQTG